MCPCFVLEPCAVLPQYQATIAVGRDAFIDAAAVMSCLDLIVTSDTSIAHSAGAPGRPVWVALEHAPDRCWTARSLRRPVVSDNEALSSERQHDWHGVFERVAGMSPY